MKKTFALILCLCLVLPLILAVPALAATPAEIVDTAYALEKGASMSAPVTLTGKLTSIDTAYSSSYKNITVSMTVEGRESKPIQCYRLAGTGADKLAVGDTITVTGTITNYNGKIQFAQGCTLDKVVSGGGTAPAAPTDPKEIVDAAYALEKGAALPYSATLTGKITKIDVPYSEQYKNINVTIVIEGREDKPILCYRLKGTGAETLEVADVITVTGTIKNYNGTIEFDSGCTLDKVVKPVVAPTDPKEIVDAAYALEKGASLPYSATLTGKITKVDTAYSEQFKNITVTIAIEGREDKPIMCFRLKGEGAAELKAGDIITVTGLIKNYNGTVEFDSGCTLDKVIPATGDNTSLVLMGTLMVLSAAALTAVLCTKKRYI